MDAKDRQIVRALQADGRLTNQELSERVNLSPSPCLRRVRRLEEDGIIKGYTAVVDQKRYGLPLTAFVRIKLARHTQDEVAAFEKAVLQIEEVIECMLMTGDADYLLRIVIADLESYENLVRRRIHRIPGIADINTSFAYGVIKSSQTLPG